MSNLSVETLSIPDLKVVRPKKFGDHRGYFSETYSAQAFAGAGIDETFVQDNQSMSADVGTIRGLHYQEPPHAQAKLVRVLKGRILDVCVDIRTSSATFGAHASVELSAEDWNQLYVPVGFAHGFAVLEPSTEVLYKVSSLYAPASERGIRWDDPALGIDWKVTSEAAILSEKDRANPSFAETTSPFE